MRWSYGKRLRCAYLRARAALRRIAQSMSGERAHVTSKGALVTMTPASDGSLNEVWSIQFIPREGSVLPKFSARLWVQYRKDGGADLEMIVECALLRCIRASQSCTALLQELAAHIERRAAAT